MVIREGGNLVRVVTQCRHLGGKRRFELKDDDTGQASVA